MEQAAAGLQPLVAAAVAGVFTVVTVIAFSRLRRVGPAGWWATGMFASLAAYLTGAWVTQTLDTEPPLWLARVWLAVLLLFPYLVLRFAASFRPVPGWVEATAALTAATVTAAAAVVPVTTGRPTPWVVGYLAVVLAYWLALSALAGVRLWQAGRGQPTVARRRMRLMSVATSVLAAGLLMSGLDGGSDVTQDLVLLAVLASGVLFAVGLTPPASLVLAWRQPEDQQLRQAMMAVLRATTSEEVAAELLPPVARIVGGSGAVVLGPDHRVVASYGEAPAVGVAVDPMRPAEDGKGPRKVIPLGEGNGQLVVWTSAYTPFFAGEEVELLATMGAFANLALERCALLREERGQHAALQEARREAEKARDAADVANTAKSEFLSRMSHELRTPLNAILGFGQLMEMSQLDAEDAEAVTHILKAGRHLLALINDVLDLSRVEAGTMTISLEPVHVPDLVDDAVDLVRPLAEARSIRLTTHVGSCEEYVHADRQRCRQVLLNLLSNAIKYNHDGGDVTVSYVRTDSDTVRVSVRDTGPGIDGVRQQRLFEPFERLGAETSGVEGTGLGLALTKQLVHAMGGEVGVESRPGEGSTFWVDLAVTTPPTETLAGRTAVVPVPSSGDARTLLLVEDNLTNLRLVEAMLRRRPDVRVLPAMQGRLAIELAHEHAPDVIILDLHLPDLSGRQVLHRLKSDPRTRHIPVIIASADATPGRLRQLRQEGALDYLTKPLDVRSFLDVVDKALAQSSELAPVVSGEEGPGDGGAYPAGRQVSLPS